MTNNMVQFSGGLLVEQHDFSRRRTLKLPSYNEAAAPEVLERDENGNALVVKDADGNPVTPQGGPAPSGDGHEGQTPVPPFTVDEDGDLVDAEGYLVAKKGEYELDDESHPVLDGNGMPVMVDPSK
ncbi:hypothetical protein PLUTO_00090 [Luteibacter phage vB_LflM-Pluto]|uniref:Uncharacterized protein n=1 Tax=Luteibacter phage vB_LflM-Pluto TaxID=2948611 RepID=A0A9E7MUK3_9CAUD|nr:hypothetical protein PLUTO_00090 [Luteibacter phage vB_LflM-Pluto]